MSIRLTCNRCSQVYEAPPQLAGKNIKCRKCGQLIAVPGPAAAPHAIPAPTDPWSTANSANDPLSGFAAPPATAPTAAAYGSPSSPPAYGGPPSAYGGAPLGQPGGIPQRRGGKRNQVKWKLIALGTSLALVVLLKIILPAFRNRPFELDTSGLKVIQLEADGRRLLPPLDPVAIPLGTEVREVSQILLAPGEPPLAVIGNYNRERLECYDLKSGQRLMVTNKLPKSSIVVAVAPNRKHVLITPRTLGFRGSFELLAIDKAAETIEPLLVSKTTNRSFQVDWADFTADGDLLACNDNGYLSQFKVPTGEQVYELKLNPFTHIALSPGKRYLVAIKKQVLVIDVASGVMLGMLPTPAGWEEQSQEVNSAEFSPNGRWLAALSGNRQGRHLTVWDVTTGETRQVTLALDGPVTWLQDDLIVYEKARYGQSSREMSGMKFGELEPEHALRFDPATLNQRGEIYVVGWPVFGSFNNQFWYAGGLGGPIGRKSPPATLFNANILPDKAAPKGPLLLKRGDSVALRLQTSGAPPELNFAAEVDRALREKLAANGITVSDQAPVTLTLGMQTESSGPERAYKMRNSSETVSVLATKVKYVLALVHREHGEIWRQTGSESNSFPTFELESGQDAASVLRLKQWSALLRKITSLSLPAEVSEQMSQGVGLTENGQVLPISSKSPAANPAPGEP